MGKVLSKSAFLSAIVLAALGVPAAAQMIDDKMAPPTLLVDPPPIEEPLVPLDDPLDDFSIAPFATYEVPVLDVPTEKSDSDDTKPMRIGTFKLLHKVTAKVRQIALRAGEEVTVGKLTLVMHDCITTPPEEPPETKAFLQVLEFKNGTDRQLFSGWMFASSPGIHALEHAVYDLWPTACKTEDGLHYTGDIVPPSGAS